MNRYNISAFLVIAFLFCGCAVKGRLTVPANKNARQYTQENISADTNMYISFDVGVSVINTGSYVGKPTDSIDVTLGIDVLNVQKRMIPELTVDELALIDTDRNDTLKVACIRFNYKEKPYSFSEIMPAFRAWGKSDSGKAAQGESVYFPRSYDLDFRMNKQQQEVKNLLLNFRFRINYEQYAIMNCRYKVKEGHRWIFPH